MSIHAGRVRFLPNGPEVSFELLLTPLALPLIEQDSGRMTGKQEGTELLFVCRRYARNVPGANLTSPCSAFRWRYPACVGGRTETDSYSGSAAGARKGPASALEPGPFFRLLLVNLDVAAAQCAALRRP